MVSPATKSQQHELCLWKPSRTTSEISGSGAIVVDDRNDDESTQLQHRSAFSHSRSYDDIYTQYCHPTPILQPKLLLLLFRYIANAVLVVQEFALSCYFLLWHRIMMTTPNESQQHQRRLRQFYFDLSMMCMYIALLVAVIVNARATAIMYNYSTISESAARKTKTRFPFEYSYYSYKAAYRILDATILAGIVRFIAALLQNLTASYSTNTVETLALTAMILHVLFCDYTYANGYNNNGYHYLRHRRLRSQQPPLPQPERVDSTISSTSSTTFRMMNQYYKSTTTSFMGGTMSLNAAFFATILLVSRFPTFPLTSTTTTTMSATTSTFMYISLSVIIFAFYPVTRNTISCIYPPRQSVVHWFITAAITISTQCLLYIVDEEQHLTYQSYTTNFWIVFVALGVLVPVWKSYMTQHKVMLRGPWDIPTRDTLNLEYKLLRVHPSKTMT